MIACALAATVACVAACDKKEEPPPGRPPAATAKDEFKIEDLKVGTGPEAKKGSKVKVHYRGTLKSGKQFDASYDRGEPFEVTIGAGGVIQGWDQGLPGMKVGGKRRLTIPSELGYGDKGQGEIPPYATLIFEIELVQIVQP
jgi:peptidylprolyl isomerase